MSCPICESPHAADVDAALRRGSGHKALARLGHLTREALDVGALCVACPGVAREDVAALVAAAVAALEQRLSEVAAELAPPPPFPVPLADVLAARDAMRANTEGAYARARGVRGHGEGIHGWT